MHSMLKNNLYYNWLQSALIGNQKMDKIYIFLGIMSKKYLWSLYIKTVRNTEEI
jgi:hypothetical protein